MPVLGAGPSAGPVSGDGAPTFHPQTVQQIVMMLQNPQLPMPMRMQLQMQLQFQQMLFFQTFSSGAPPGTPPGMPPGMPLGMPPGIPPGDLSRQDAAKRPHAEGESSGRKEKQSRNT